MELANDLVRRKVDMIVTAGPGVAAAMRPPKQYRLFSVSVVIRLKLVLSKVWHGREKT